MSGIEKIPLTIPQQWNAEWFRMVLIEILAKLDIRNPNTAFSGGIKAVDGNIIIGTDAGIDGRPSSSIPVVLDKITDAGTAEDQRFLPQVSTGGVSSRQDAGPVTADATIVTAQIDIAAHTLQYGFGSVSYGSGTITGLDPETNYYVYADDPEYAGGAVSYIATTNGQAITSDNGRYFVGAVRTTVALATGTISAATLSNPVQFTTTAAHGWNTGNTVDFDGLPGDFGAALNNGTFTITRTGATTFTVPVNSSAFGAYTSGGTVTRIASTSISGQGGAAGWIDNAFLVQF